MNCPSLLPIPSIFISPLTSLTFIQVKKALSEGDKVVATARNSSKLKFDGANDSNFLATDLDVTDSSSVDKAFDAALKKFGRVDVVVNNAGYGLAGEFESVSEEQARTQFEVSRVNQYNLE